MKAISSSQLELQHGAEQGTGRCDPSQGRRRRSALMRDLPPPDRCGRAIRQ